MREILYKFSSAGTYLTDNDTAFGNDTELKIIAEPHSFSLALSGEVLRSSVFEGCTIVVSNEGEAAFYDNSGSLTAKAEKGEKTYEMVKFKWNNDESVSVMFGYIAIIDYYPDCDGEHDRWGERWTEERCVTLSLKDNSLTVK